MDQTETPLELDHEQVERFYLPLAASLVNRMAAQKRLLIAVAGPPGSGKSAFSAILCAVLNAHLDEEATVVVGLDGWHFPNAYLESHFVERDGVRIPLKTFKGSPASFDAAAALNCFREISLGKEVRYPVYSRVLHDPLPDAGRVLSRHRYVIVEGNFLLLDEDPWREFQAIFDCGIFLKASPEVCLAGLLERHRRVGKSEAAVRHQIEVVDLPNVHLILAHSRGAEFVVEKTDPRRISRVDRRGLQFVD